MATIGTTAYPEVVHEFFEGHRTYDMARIEKTLHDRVLYQLPVRQFQGKEATMGGLTTLFEDTVNRPSFTIRNMSGGGNHVTLDVMMSGRFGGNGKLATMDLIVSQGQIHQAVVRYQ